MLRGVSLADLIHPGTNKLAEFSVASSFPFKEFDVDHSSFSIELGEAEKASACADGYADPLGEDRKYRYIVHGLEKTQESTLEEWCYAVAFRDKIRYCPRSFWIDEGRGAALHAALTELAYAIYFFCVLSAFLARNQCIFAVAQKRTCDRCLAERYFTDEAQECQSQFPREIEMHRDVDGREMVRDYDNLARDSFFRLYQLDLGFYSERNGKDPPCSDSESYSDPAQNIGKPPLPFEAKSEQLGCYSDKTQDIPDASSEDPADDPNRRERTDLLLYLPQPPYELRQANKGFCDLVIHGCSEIEDGGLYEKIEVM